MERSWQIGGTSGETFRFSMPHGWETVVAGKEPEQVALSEVLSKVAPDNWPEVFRAHNGGIQDVLGKISGAARNAAGGYEPGDSSFFQPPFLMGLEVGGRTLERLSRELADAQRLYPEA